VYRGFSALALVGWPEEHLGYEEISHQQSLMVLAGRPPGDLAEPGVISEKVGWLLLFFTFFKTKTLISRPRL